MSPLASGSFLEVPSSPRPPCLSGSRWGCLSLLTVNVGQSFSSPRAQSPPTRKLEQNSISHSETPGKQPARLWGDRPPEGRLAGSAVQSPRTSSAAPHNAKPRPRPAVPCLGVPVPGKLRSGARGDPMPRPAQHVQTAETPQAAAHGRTMHKMGSATQCLRSPLRTPAWAGSAAGHCPPHPVLAAAASQPPRLASYGETKGPGSHGPPCRPAASYGRILSRPQSALWWSHWKFSRTQRRKRELGGPQGQEPEARGCLRTRTCCPREP